jgi:hypothetical protein
VLDIAEETTFQTYVSMRKDASLTGYCETFIDRLRGHMRNVALAPDTPSIRLAADREQRAK